MSTPMLFLPAVLLIAACQSNVPVPHTANVTVAKIDTVQTVQTAPQPAVALSRNDLYAGLDTSDAPLPGLGKDTTALALDTIQGLPDFTDGCVLMAAGSRKALRQSTFLVAGDFSVLLMKVKGIPVYLHASRTRVAGEDDQWYEGHGFTVHIHTNDRTNPDANDSIIYDGVMEVEQGHRKISIPVSGGIGC